jgi:hypothetical protein
MAGTGTRLKIRVTVDFAGFVAYTRGSLERFPMTMTMTMKTLRAAAAVVTCILTPGGLVSPAGAQSTSASYVLQESTTDGAGGAAASASWRLEGSAGQESAVGTSSSPRFVLQSGFWGHAGSGLGPVRLTLDRNTTTSENLDLTWTGANAPFRVYESDDCASVYATLLTSTSGNQILNLAPPAAPLVCYSILATAPGP